MGDHNLEECLKSAFKLVNGLVAQIDHKNHKLVELQFKYEDVTADIRNVINRLTDKLNQSQRDEQLLELDQRFHHSATDVRLLMYEKAMLCARHTAEIMNLESTIVDLKDIMERQKRKVKKLTREHNLERKSLMDEMEKAPQLGGPMGDHNLEECLKSAFKLGNGLVAQIDHKNHKLVELQFKYEDVTADIRNVVNRLTDKLNQSQRDEQLLELDQRFRHSATDVRLLMYEKAMLFARHTAEIMNLKSTIVDLKDIMECQKRKVKKLTREHDLERKSLMDEMEKLKGKPQTQKETERSGCEIDALRKELKEKEDALQYAENLNNVLTTKERISNQELQSAREEAITGLQDVLNNRTTLGIKRMGVVDHKAFHDPCMLKFPNGDWEDISAKICSQWEENVKDPHWYPFRKEVVDGQLKEKIDDDDEKLKGLRNEYGNAVYEAVTSALQELNEYNPSGRYPVAEIWNVKEGRRASLKEVIQYIIKQLKSHKHKRKR